MYPVLWFVMLLINNVRDYMKKEITIGLNNETLLTNLHKNQEE
jgi:hypothetical protein